MQKLAPLRAMSLAVRVFLIRLLSFESGLFLILKSGVKNMLLIEQDEAHSILACLRVFHILTDVFTARG